VSLTEFFIGIIAISAVAAAALLIPSLIQIRKTAKSIQTLSDHLDSGLPPLIQGLTETAQELRATSLHLRQQLELSGEAAENLRITSARLKNAGDALLGTVMPLIATLGGARAGIKAFMATFTGHKC